MGRNKGSATNRFASGGARDDSGFDAAAEDHSASGSAGAEARDSEPSSLTGAIPDLFRRAMALGLSGFFMTEETIRKAVGDTLPRDWVDFVSAQSERTRSELMQRMSEEIGRAMERVDIGELLEQLLAGRTVEVTAQIRLGDRRASAEEPVGADRPAGGEAETVPKTVRVEVAGGENSER